MSIILRIGCLTVHTVLQSFHMQTLDVLAAVLGLTSVNSVSPMRSSFNPSHPDVYSSIQGIHTDVCHLLTAESTEPNSPYPSSNFTLRDTCTTFGLTHYTDDNFISLDVRLPASLDLTCAARTGIDQVPSFITRAHACKKPEAWASNTDIAQV